MANIENESNRTPERDTNRGVRDQLLYNNTEKLKYISTRRELRFIYKYIKLPNRLQMYRPIYHTSK